MAKMLKLDNDTKLKIIDESLTHIKKVEADPDIEMDDRDPYDAWLAFNERIDFNVSEANFGNDEWMEEGEPMEWNCSAYSVELDENEFARVNTDHMISLFSYKDGKVIFHNE
jgi:hypothetical protein